MRTLLKVFAFFSLIFATIRLCHLATDGFACVNIYAPPGNNDKWRREGIPDPALLSQTYSYLTCGSQSYVFVSEDGQTILKLFKFHHMRIPPWMEILPLPFLEAKKEKKRKVLEATFDSYAIAFDEMQKETGLLFIHLAKTDHIQKKLTIIDKIGKRHILDLDRVEFALQKRGTLAYRCIEEWMERGEIKKAKQGIQELFELTLNRCKKGIFDKDPDFSTNYGFIQSQPILIDFGRFSRNPSEKEHATYHSEMIRITRSFRKWVEKNYPDLLETFDNELNRLIR